MKAWRNRSAQHVRKLQCRNRTPGGNPVVGLQHWTNHRINHQVFAVAVCNGTPGDNPVVDCGTRTPGVNPVVDRGTGPTTGLIIRCSL